MSLQETCSVTTRTYRQLLLNIGVCVSVDKGAYLPQSVLKQARVNLCIGKRKIEAEKSSPSQLWRLINVFLGHGGVPSCDNMDAQQIHDYIDATVAGVQSSTDGASPPSFTTLSSDVYFTSF